VISNVGQLRDLLGIRSPQQLGFLLVASDHDNGPYTRFTIPKRDGKDREICAPKKQLRWVQRFILDKILARVPVHEAAHGFVPGRSTVSNAQPHQGAEVILKFDLTDFFPTIHYYRVVGTFASLGYFAGDGKFSTDDESRQVAPTLARLCCYTPEPRAWGNAVAPQGAPTSPALSNIVCRRLDARLAGLAKRNKGVYTRYADDLTFSFRDVSGVELGRFRWWVDQICHQEGFFLNQKKFRVIRAAQRQLVTGIVVNDELRVPREVRRRFRAILHNCRVHGIESQARGKKGFPGYLRGLASYIHMVHPEEGVELLKEVEALLGPDMDEEGESQ
jgi:retron-type reverse transcriptase